jgi:hypothetical protein
MKYFTRDQHDAVNSTDNSAIAAAMEEFNKNAELYREQLEKLRARLSPKVQKFFETLSLHDGTLQRMSVGDDISVVLPTGSRGAFVNKRKLSVLLEVLDAEGKRRHALRYRKVRRVTFDYPSAEPWYLRYSDPGSNPIDDWLADELTAADDKFLRHEVLFSSGTTLLIEFMEVSIRTTTTA